MPRNPAAALSEELARRGYELLDIYKQKGGSVIRVSEKGSGRVGVVQLKVHIDSLTSREDVAKVADEIVSKVRGKRR